MSFDAYATASLPLQDLDGAVIGTSGWYDFTAKTDEDGNRISDGGAVCVRWFQP